MKGSKPKPTVLRLLQGKPGKRPINHNEPWPEPAIPTCPSVLSELAKAEWRRIAPELYRLGLLTNLDRAALAIYVQSWARWTEATRKAQAEGLVGKSRNGHPIPSPWLAVARAAAVEMVRVMPELGLSPSARTRIKAAPPETRDEFEELLRGP